MRKSYEVKGSCLLLLALFWSHLNYGQRCNVVGQLPEPVSNNAVAFVHNSNNQTFPKVIYSFCGIDSSKADTGIHLKAFKFDYSTKTASVLPSVPDTMGKVAASASYIDSIIYVVGGYHVLPNRSEVSSKLVHRFDTRADTFLPNGADIPVPIDDQVQVVKGKYIYIITGWSDGSNVNNVQIYDTELDTWMIGTPTPNTQQFKAFGANGVIKDSVIYYFGGAIDRGSFPSKSYMRKGIIDKQDPAQITWSLDTTLSTTGYRMGAGITNGSSYPVTFFGGSIQSFNYDGRDYVTNNPVSPFDSAVVKGGFGWETERFLHPIMDLRAGLTYELMEFGFSTVYSLTAGGMDTLTNTSDAVIECTLREPVVGVLNAQKLIPKLRLNNPVEDYIQLFDFENGSYKIYNLNQQLIADGKFSRHQIDIGDGLSNGTYILEAKSLDHNDWQPVRAQFILNR